MKEIVEPTEELAFYDQEKLVKSFCYLKNGLNASGDCKNENWMDKI